MGVIIVFVVSALGACAGLALVVGGVRGLLVARHKATAGERGEEVEVAAVKLLGAVLVAAAFTAAMRIAEGSSNWVDANGDGTLDGFAKDSHNWADVNGTVFAQSFAAVATTIVLGVIVAVNLVRRRRRPSLMTQ